MDYWLIVYVVGGLSLLFFANKGANAVWGTATLGLLVGIGIAIFQSGFDWTTIAKAVTAAATIGLAFELLPRLAGRQ